LHDELVDHAARVLRRAADGALDAAALYDRISRETGILCGVRLMLDRLSAQPARFTILPAQAALGGTTAWEPSDRAAYGLALTSALPDAWPIVTLCEEQEPGAAPDRQRPGVAEAAPAEDAGLRDMHRSLAALLRSPGADPGLLYDVSSAVAALDAAGLFGRQHGRRRQ